MNRKNRRRYSRERTVQIFGLPMKLTMPTSLPYPGPINEKNHAHASVITADSASPSGCTVCHSATCETFSANRRAFSARRLMVSCVFVAVGSPRSFATSVACLFPSPVPECSSKASQSLSKLVQKVFRDDRFEARSSRCSTCTKRTSVSIQEGPRPKQR